MSGAPAGTVQALRARTAGRSAGVGRRRALAGSVTTATVLPVMSKNSTEGAFLGGTPSSVPLHDRSDVACTQAMLGYIASKDHVNVLFKWHVLRQTTSSGHQDARRRRIAASTRSALPLPETAASGATLSA